MQEWWLTVATQDDELEQLGDADDDLEADALDDQDEGEDESEDEAAEGEVGVEDEGGETSLDRLIAQRDARRRVTDDGDDDEDLLALASDAAIVPGEPVVERVEPVAARREFVCRRCFLVKRRSQLADADRMLCRDCV